MQPDQLTKSMSDLDRKAVGECLRLSARDHNIDVDIERFSYHSTLNTTVVTTGIRSERPLTLDAVLSRESLMFAFLLLPKQWGIPQGFYTLGIVQKDGQSVIRNREGEIVRTGTYETRTHKRNDDAVAFFDVDCYSNYTGSKMVSCCDFDLPFGISHSVWLVYDPFF